MPAQSPALLVQLEEQVYEALRLWHASEAKGSPLQGLRLLRTQQSAGVGLRQASNQLLRQALEQLKATHPDKSTILQLRFADDLPAHVVAGRQNVSEATVWRWQQEGVRLIAAALLSREENLRQEQHRAMVARLPAPAYSHLIGVERLVEQLLTPVLQAESPWLIALEGIGGIGKTTLAQVLVRRLIEQDHWVDVAWVTAQQRSLNLGGALKTVAKPALTVAEMVEVLFAQLWPEGGAPGSTLRPAAQGMTYEGRLNALESRLKAQPHLLVIDNLETHWDVESLLATLRRFVGPSKVLLTTRQRLLAEADLFHFSLPELSATDALHLVRLEAQTRNLPELAAASAAELQPIYAALGGNPLALRLVVGQLHIHPLDRVIADLKAARGLPIANLYTYIYRQAWELLDESARQTLILLLLTAEQGEPFAELAAIAASQLAEVELRDALDQLVALSLVDARGGLHERRYAIHSLTRSFLHRQVLQWAAPDQETR